MIYVKDVADILVQALLTDHDHYVYTPERDKDNPVKFEAGTGRATTVLDIAQMVVEAVGNGTIEHAEMRPGEPPRSVVLGDPNTLRPLYGGSQPHLTSLEIGLKETVRYYRDLYREGNL